METFLSGFVAAYREEYSCNHVLMRLVENWKRALDKNFQIGTILMDLSTAFDCIAKLYAYGLSEETTTFFYSYLKRRGQRVRIDDILRSLQVLISGVPQGSILGPILFNIFLNELLEILKNSDIYNFADDNVISVASKKRDTLLETLKNESESAVNWFRNNNMIVNPEKFQLMLLQKSTKKLIQEKLQIDNKKNKSENSVTLLGITIDNRLSFDDHVSKLCNKASMQLKAIFILKKYMSQKELEVVPNSFIYSNFNYCPLLWHFSTNKSIEKLENIHKHCLRLTFNHYKSDYTTLLDKSGKESMKIRRIKTLAIEIFKTANELNFNFMKTIFTSKTNSRVRPFDLLVKNRNTEKYGSKILMALGRKIWNVLPEKIKKETSFSKLKENIKSWSGLTCKCKMCLIIYKLWKFIRYQRSL